MPRRHRSAILGASLLAGALLPVMASPGAVGAAPKIAISGVLDSSDVGYRVVLLSPSGTGAIATVDPTTHAFSFSVPSKAVRGASLQLVAPSGAYAGPVVLKSEKVSDTTRVGHEQLAGASVDLGTVTPVIIDGSVAGAVVSSKPNVSAPGTRKTFYLKDAVKVGEDRLPLGAGRAGLIKKKLVGLSDEERARASGSPDYLAAPTSAVHGLNQLVQANPDVDGDGVPNVFDVDDNGNRSMDSVDPASAQTTATLNPWSDIRKDYANGGSTYNASLSGASVSASDVADAIGGRGQFGTWFFINEGTLSRSGSMPSGGQVSWLQIDCGDLPYCGASAAHDAGYGVPGEISSAFSSLVGDAGVLWKDWKGAAFNCAEGSPGGPVPDLAGPPYNALSLMCRDNGPKMPPERVWTGMLAPNTGSDTLADFRPGDTYVLRFQVDGEAAPRTIPMVLPPIYATVPGLVSVNGAAPAGDGTFSPDGSGHLTLTFFRPQRLAVASDPTFGAASPFMDQAGLHYGLILGAPGASKEFGCKPSRYAVSSNLTKDPDPTNPWQQVLWPTTDNLRVDSAPVAGGTGTTYQIDVDVAGCLADAVSAGIITGSEASGRNPYFGSLTAAGEYLTGGANRSTLTFRVTPPVAP